MSNLPRWIMLMLAAVFCSPGAAAKPEGQPLFAGGRDGYHTYRIPALAVATNGTLLAFCEGRVRGAGDSGDIDLVLKRSTDAGKTWSAQQVVWDDTGNCCGNPCAVVDRETGTVHAARKENPLASLAIPFVSVMILMMLVMIFVLWPRASVSAKRINEVLETEPSILDGTRVDGEAGKTGEIEFRDVSFRYPGAADDVLCGINFTAKQGEIVAFIGSTGSGKTTLVNLIPRFYDATSGEVLVDGVNVKDYTQDALHNKVGYVPQKAVSFRGTVASNIAYGENGKECPSDDEIQTAMRIAQGADFVEQMDGQYEAEVAQGGSNLSGGQKQRLAIARAVARKPEIYIFDDSFSALDYKTDRALRSALRRETAGVTSLIVAQRIGTILDADQIIVLNDGQIVGKGTHKELLKTCDVYQEIAMSQLSEEELSA